MGRKNKIAQFNQLLLKYQSKREVIKINRFIPNGEDNIYGIILKLSDSFIHVAPCYEFKFNGDLIIRKDQFEFIRCNKYDKSLKRILKKEKQLSGSHPVGIDINLSTWKSIFTDLVANDTHVIIECENLKKPTFTIGSIEKINNNSLLIWNYDPSGQLDKKPTKIKFKNITKLQFNEHYSKTFRKYLKKPKRKD